MQTPNCPKCETQTVFIPVQAKKHPVFLIEEAFYQCPKCNWKSENRLFEISNEVEEYPENNQCPKCHNRLYLKTEAEGYVCKNWKCENYWKMGKGKVFKILKMYF
jgi:hypothetical protein